MGSMAFTKTLILFIPEWKYFSLPLQTCFFYTQLYSFPLFFFHPDPDCDVKSTLCFCCVTWRCYWQCVWTHRLCFVYHFRHYLGNVYLLVQSKVVQVRQHNMNTYPYKYIVNSVKMKWIMLELEQGELINIYMALFQCCDKSQQCYQNINSCCHTFRKLKRKTQVLSIMFLLHNMSIRWDDDDTTNRTLMLV